MPGLILTGMDIHAKVFRNKPIVPTSMAMLTDLNLETGSRLTKFLGTLMLPCNPTILHIMP